jgi:hypothetical protein
MRKNPMKSKLLCIITLLAAVLPTLAVSGSKSQGVVLSFKNMFAVSGPFTSTNLRDIPGDAQEWTINKMIKGQLDANGRLDIKVRGLLQGGNPPNPEPEFYAAVSCLTTGEDVNNPPNLTVVTENVITSGFSADPDGNANIKAKLQLPSPCVAPVVMILNGDPNDNGVWLAVTGFDPVGGH